MHSIPSSILAQANEAAIYNLYLYLAHKTTPADHETLSSIVDGLAQAQNSQSPQEWTDREVYRLHILKNAINRHAVLAHSKISHFTQSTSGLNACVFTNPDGKVFVAFRGTSNEEWMDNGEGLSGMPEENTYILYNENNRMLSRKTIQKDYATDQQVEALSWFYSIAAKNGWNAHTRIILSGHSKGGNKAQFITIHSDLVDACYSFSGQGFSPEALAALKNQYGAQFETRRQKVMSFATANDYVNVLGERLMPKHQIYFFKSSLRLHSLDAMLDENGQFYPQSEQGKLSQYVESVSTELMRVRPFVRQYITVGVMRILQKYLREQNATTDTFSLEQKLADIRSALAPILRYLRDQTVSKT